METFAIILTTILGGGIGGIAASWFFNKKSLIHKVNFERKQNRYTHIIAIIEVYLDPKSIELLANKPIWDYTKLEMEQCKDKALYELKINYRQTMFLTKSKKLIEAYKNFLIMPTEDNAKLLIDCFRKDLWR